MGSIITKFRQTDRQRDGQTDKHGFIGPNRVGPKKVEKILSVRFSLHREGKIIPSRPSLKNTNTIIRLGTILPFNLPSFQPSIKLSPLKLQKY